MRLAKIIVSSGNSQPVVHSFQKTTITVGRNPDNTIVIDDESVSGHHAEISTADGIYILRDLHSSNGTTVNGAPVTEIELHDCDAVCFGAVGCKFYNQPTPDQSETSEPQPAPILPDESADKTESPASFGSQLVGLGKAAFGEAQRGGRLAALKTRIEKLKLVDLNKAHYALGKKCYDLGLHAELLATRRAEIAELEARIQEKRKGTTHTDEETTAAKIKRIAGDAKTTAEAEGLAIKVKQLLTECGKKIAALTNHHNDVREEIAVVSQVSAAIRDMEKEMTGLREDTANRSHIKTLSRSLLTATASQTSNLAKRAFPRFWKYRRLVLTICLIAATAVGVLYARNHFLARLAAEPPQKEGTNASGRLSADARDTSAQDNEVTVNVRTLGISRWDVTQVVDENIRWQEGTPIEGHRNLVGTVGTSSEAILNLVGSEADLTFIRLVFLYKDTNVSHNLMVSRILAKVSEATLGASGREYMIQNVAAFLARPEEFHVHSRFGKRFLRLAGNTTGDAQFPLILHCDIVPSDQ